MRRLFVPIAILCFSLPVFANTEQDFLKARTEYLCSWMSLSSYHDKIGNVARDELSQRGWNIEQEIHKTDKAEAKFNIAKKQDLDDGKVTTLVSVAGTSSLADVKLDMRIKPVAYHENGTDDIKVHSGFNAYTNTLLDSPYGKTGTVRDMLYKLKSDPNNQAVIFTGHSLGGAVAVLLGTRMADAGEKDIHVITFGAPAVGNDAFINTYEDAIHLDRVVISGDPVKNILQNLTGTYSQFANETKWEEPSNLDHFQHKMIVYADAALRNYYDAKRAYESELGRELIERTRAIRTVNLFVAPLVFDLDEDLGIDEKYMEWSANDYIRNVWHGLVFSKQTAPSLNDVCRQALQAHCQYVLVRHITGHKLRDARNTYRMKMEEEIYDTKGTLISGQEYTTKTENMTPIEAVLYLTRESQQKRVLVN